MPGSSSLGICTAPSLPTVSLQPACLGTSGDVSRLFKSQLLPKMCTNERSIKHLQPPSGQGTSVLPGEGLCPVLSGCPADFPFCTWSQPPHTGIASFLWGSVSHAGLVGTEEHISSDFPPSSPAPGANHILKIDALRITSPSRHNFVLASPRV